MGSTSDVDPAIVPPRAGDRMSLEFGSGALSRTSKKNCAGSGCEID
jgi:hypothetical protein